MEFEFTTANRIIFGPGTARQTGKLARKLGRNALVVTGRASDRNRFLFQDLTSHNIEFTMLPIPEEPTVAMISSGADEARKVGCDLVIAIGGGSAIDSGKAIAALLTNPGRLTDYLEVVGKGKSIREDPAPSIVLPTTAGTGAEVTCNSVLLSEESRVKVSMRSPLMLPRVAIVDPELTYSMPPDVTAATGLDVFYSTA
jgi:alcohol dehydrogenase class IV